MRKSSSVSSKTGILPIGLRASNSGVLGFDAIVPQSRAI